MTFPAKRDPPLQRPPPFVRKIVSTATKQTPHPPFFSCSLSNEILPRIHPGIKISSATSLFSQLRNPSRKRANSANNRAFSRPSPVKGNRAKDPLFSYPPPSLLLSNERCFSRQLPPSFSFFDLFCTVSLSYVSSNVHRNPRLGFRLHRHHHRHSV